MTVLSGSLHGTDHTCLAVPGQLHMGHLSLCPVVPVDSDDSVVGSRYMVSTMLIWIVQQDSGKSLSFFLLLRSTCFTADRQPTNSTARWRHPRYFYTVARKLRRCSSRQPAAASALALLVRGRCRHAPPPPTPRAPVSPSSVAAAASSYLTIQ